MESTTSTVASVSVEGKGKGKQEMAWGGKGVMKMEMVLSLRGVEVREGVKEEEEGEEEEGEEEEDVKVSRLSSACSFFFHRWFGWSGRQRKGTRRSGARASSRT